MNKYVIACNNILLFADACALKSCSYVNPGAITYIVCKRLCRIRATSHLARRSISPGISRRAPAIGLKISPRIYSTVGNSRVVPDVSPMYITPRSFSPRCSRSSDTTLLRLMRKCTPDVPASR